MATQSNSTDSLTSLLKLFQTFSGSSGTQTTSGGTTTKQTILSQDVLNAMLKSAMEGTGGVQGLAQVAGGQRAAGMYDSTVNTQLTNDLMSRLATQTAVAGAPTVTTSPKTTVTTAAPGVGMGGVGMIGGLSLAKNLLDPKSRKSLLEQLGLGDSGSSTAVNVDNIGAFAETPMMMMMGASAGGETIQNISAADLISYWDAASAADTFVPDTESLNAFYESIGATGDYEIGDVLTAASEGIAENVVGDIAGDAPEFDFWDCFLTTAVCKYQGKDDNCYELTTLRNFRDTWLKENHPEDIDTYYAEAPEIVKKLEKLPTPEFIFDRMYSSYILPAIEHIEEGNNAAAYRIYKQLFQFCEAL